LRITRAVTRHGTADSWPWGLNERPAAKPATLTKARSMKAPALIARVHAKPRTGDWIQQVVGAPGVAFSVAMAPRGQLRSADAQDHPVPAVTGAAHRWLEQR
jgi:hypothetical protein